MNITKLHQRLCMIMLLSLLISMQAGCTSRSPATPQQGNGEPNRPIEVDAGPNQTVAEQTLIVLSGRVTPPGGTYGYHWEPAPSNPTSVSGSGTNRISASFVAPSTQTVTDIEFIFTVTDAEGTRYSDNVIVTVNPVNSPPKINTQTKNYTANELAEVSIPVQISDDDGSVEEIIWRQITGPQIPLPETHSDILTFTAPSVREEEEVVLSVYAKDNEGGISTKEITILVNPREIPPVISGAFQAAGQSFDKISLTFNVHDPDNGLKDFDWSLDSGPEPSIELNSNGEMLIVMPDVLEPSETRLKLIATDEDNLSTEQTLTLNISPQATIPFKGFVAFGPEMNYANINVQRLVDGKHLPLSVIRSTLSSGPLGTFSMTLPGYGLYEFDAQLAIKSEHGSQEPISFSALIDVTNETDSVTINLLTTLSNQAHDTSSQTQLIEELEKLALLPEQPFWQQHIYEHPNVKGSHKLKILNELIKNYASTMSEQDAPLARYNTYLNLLTNGLNDSSTTEFFLRLAESVRDLDLEDIENNYKLAASADENIKTLAIQNKIDLDLDGSIDAVDSDDDNDGTSDSEDLSPRGFRFKQPKCQLGDIADILTSNQTEFNIVNRWKPEQYLNLYNGKLRASPIISPLQLGATWSMEKSEIYPDSFLIRLRDENQLLAIDQNNKIVLTNANDSTDSQHLWTIEKAYPHLQNVRLYHLRYRNNQGLYLSNLIQNSNPNKLFDIFIDENHQDDSWASQWGFCDIQFDAETQQSMAKDTPNDFLETACSGNEYTTGFDEAAVYNIQSASRLSQYLNREKGLQSSPIINGNARHTQWRITPAPLSDTYLISSELDNLYLQTTEKNKLYLSPLQNEDAPNQLALWQIERFGNQTFRLVNEYTKQHIELDQAAYDGLTVTHEIKMGSQSNVNQNQLWRACKISER